jgi:hypothetical protein
MRSGRWFLVVVRLEVCFMLGHKESETYPSRVLRVGRLLVHFAALFRACLFLIRSSRLKTH